MKGVYRHICFIVAMQAEAEGLINHFQLKEKTDRFDKKIPMRLFQNTYKNITISLITNGKDPITGIDNIGTQAAVLTSYLAYAELKPDLLINAGTAGGFKDMDLNIGDVVLASGKAYFHDRRISIPDFQQYAIGAYPLADYTNMINKLGLKTGIISTGNSFGYNDDDLLRMREFNTSIKDMEAAAIAWTANLLHIPLIVLKGVTDYVISEVSSVNEFKDNFKRTVKNLTKKAADIIDYLIENP